VRKQPLRCEDAHLFAAPPCDTQLIPHLRHPGDERGTTHQHRTTGSGRRTLSSAEAQDRNVADSAKARASQMAPRSLRGILDYRNAVRNREFPYSADVGWVSVKVGYNDCVHASVYCLPHRIQIGTHRVWVHIV
jgi:hypothetical protein